MASYNIDTSAVLLWQYDKATRLKALLQANEDLANGEVGSFWRYYQASIFSLDTADAFGLRNWGRIVGQPWPVYANGELIPEDAYRAVLKARFYLATAEGSVADICEYFSKLFSSEGGAAIKIEECINGRAMTIRYNFIGHPTSLQKAILTSCDSVVPIPVAVLKSGNAPKARLSSYFGLDGIYSKVTGKEVSFLDVTGQITISGEVQELDHMYLGYAEGSVRYVTNSPYNIFRDSGEPTDTSPATKYDDIEEIFLYPETSRSFSYNGEYYNRIYASVTIYQRDEKGEFVYDKVTGAQLKDAAESGVKSWCCKVSDGTIYQMASSSTPGAEIKIYSRVTDVFGDTVSGKTPIKVRGYTSLTRLPFLYDEENARFSFVEVPAWEDRATETSGCYILVKNSKGEDEQTDVYSYTSGASVKLVYSKAGVMTEALGQNELNFNRGVFATT